MKPKEEIAKLKEARTMLQEYDPLFGCMIKPWLAFSESLSELCILLPKDKAIELIDARIKELEDG